MEEQKICKSLGESGCYFFCLLKFANKENDAINIYKEAVALNFMDKDCFIKDPVALLKHLTNKKYSVVKQTESPVDGDLIIARFANKRTGLKHFAIVDKNNNITYDPLGESVTVSEGYIESYRIFIGV